MTTLHAWLGGRGTGKGDSSSSSDKASRETESSGSKWEEPVAVGSSQRASDSGCIWAITLVAVGAFFQSSVPAKQSVRSSIVLTLPS